LPGANGPPLTGSDFLSVWSNDSLFELASKIRNTMPQTEPGTLTAEQAADIVSYVLQSNKFPVGRTELRADEAALKAIAWPAGNNRQAKPAAAAAQAASFPPVGNLAQVMRGILFPSSNIIFTVQTVDPGAKPAPGAGGTGKNDGGFNWMLWGADIYKGWDLVDYAGCLAGGVCTADADARAALRERQAGSGKRSRVDQIHAGTGGFRQSGVQGIAVAKSGGGERYQ
jgi:hypothetical protein